MRFEVETRTHLQLASCRTARIARCKSRFAVCEDLINQVRASGMRDMQAGMNFDAEGAQAAAAFVLCSSASLGKSVTYHHVVSVWQMMMRFHAVVETWKWGETIQGSELDCLITVQVRNTVIRNLCYHVGHQVMILQPNCFWLENIWMLSKASLEKSGPCRGWTYPMFNLQHTK